MDIIPAIDIIDGRCVRLTKGDYDSLKSYSSDPFSMARRFEDAGLKRLHLVDLDGARGGGIQNLKVLERIAKGTSLSVDFGGGIKSENALSSAFSAGASFVTCGSIAIKDRKMTLSLLERYSGRLILGADSKDGIVKASGWLEDGSVDVITFIKSYENAGFKYVISTDIAKDGMLSGPSFSLYERIMGATSIPLIASGGVSGIEDLKRLKKMGLSGAIVGKAYYEGLITLDEMKEVSDAC